MPKNLNIDDKVWQKLILRLKKDHHHARVGVLSSDQHVDGDLSIAELAAIHEYGTKDGRIPERSFIRSTFKEKEKELKELTRKVAHKIIDDGMDIKDGLEILGAWGAAEIKKTVTEGEGVSPPLKQGTIDRKGSSRPLVDTGRMIDSVTWDVKV